MNSQAVKTIISLLLDGNIKTPYTLGIHIITLEEHYPSCLQYKLNDIT